MNPELPDALESRLEGCSFEAVTVGESGANVYRVFGPGASDAMLLKVAPVSSDPDPGMSVRAEAERLAWMLARGLRVPKVLAFFERGGFEYLLTTALRGRDASRPWVEQDIERVVEALAKGLRLLHSVPIADCPFDQSLDAKLEQAQRRVSLGLVDSDDFDAEHAGRSAEHLLAEALERRPASEDLVFCHGDYYAQNVLIRFEPIGLAGFVDVGRAGIADRYQDLALVRHSLESDTNPSLNGRWAALLEHYGLTRLDEEKLGFYHLLDEFF